MSCFDTVTFGIFDDDPPPAPEPQVPDLGESLIDYVNAMLDPEFREKYETAERSYRDMQQELGMSDLWASTFGLGTEPQGGSIDLLERILPRVSKMQQDALGSQREADIADIERLGTRATEALRASDPEMQKLLGQQGELTDMLMSRAYGVTGQQQRMAEQQARGAGMARGRGYGEGTIAQEILGREELQQANRAEALGAAQQRFGMLGQTAADPFQAILGRPGMAYTGAAQQQGFNAGLGAQNLQTGVLDPNMGVNFNMAQSGMLNDYMANVYGSQLGYKGAVKGASLGFFGDMFGGFLGGG
jgi:hypothetical protein